MSPMIGQEKEKKRWIFIRNDLIHPENACAATWDIKFLSISHLKHISLLRAQESTNNASLIINNKPNINIREIPHRTPPMRHIIQMPDYIKYSYIQQKEKCNAERVKISILDRNLIGRKPQLTLPLRTIASAHSISKQ